VPVLNNGFIPIRIPGIQTAKRTFVFSLYPHKEHLYNLNTGSAKMEYGITAKPFHFAAVNTGMNCSQKACSILRISRIKQAPWKVK
jgi:hypothetical protein